MSQKPLKFDQKLFAALLSAIPALVLVLDREGEIAWMNAACERLSGYSLADLQGKKFWDVFLPPEEVRKVRAILAKPDQDNGPAQIESTWVARNGEARRISWTSTPYLTDSGNEELLLLTGLAAAQNGAIEDELHTSRAELERRVQERTAGLALEIERRMQVEAALRESETDLRSLLEKAQGFAIYRVVVDSISPYVGKILLVSPSLTEITGIRDPYDFACWFENVHPEDEPRIVAANRYSFENKVPYDEMVRLYHPQKKRWVWLHTISSPVIDENGEVTHFNGLVIDVTQQMLAEEARKNLLAFEEIVTSISTRFINLETSHIDDGIQQALKVVGEFTGDDRSYIFCYSDDHSRMDCVYEWCAPGISAEIDRLKDISVEILPWLNRWLLAKEVLYIESVVDLPAEARADQAELTRQGIQSLLAVPMQHQGRVIGFLGFDSVRQKKTWNRESIALLHIVGEIFVNALKRKEAQQTLEQAYQTLELRVDERTRQLQDRRKVAEGLRDILSMINTNQPLADVLNFILDRACQLARASGGVIYRLDQEAGLSYPEACSGMPDGFSSLGPFPIVNWGPQKDVLDNKPSILYDFPERINQALQNAENADPRLLGWARLMVANFQAYLSFPLFIGSKLYGALSLVYREPRQLTQEELDLVVTFASQASLAIENTSLRAQAAQAAVTAERSRIARDLHDAVTQTLFASSLIAEVLPVLWDRKPDEARRRLEEVRRLNKAALAEMRTLLLELKPSALLEAEIPDLFRHLCDAFSGRTMVPVHQDLDASIELSGEAKVAFYRIAQEGLNNISKHAEATQVWLTLRRISPEAGIELSLRDDGRGFDPQQISFENLGLGIMQERADSLGAHFCLKARPGQGVEITVRLHT